MEAFVSELKEWAARQADIQAVLLVGSHARGAPRPDSDVDLMILTTERERYLEDVSFVETFGAVARWQTEDWGQVTLVRVWYESGREVEFGIALPAWAREPLDAGTRRVVEDGVRILFDREGAVSHLEE